MNLLLLRQAGENNPAPDAGVVWRTLAGMVESLLARAPYILIALIVFAGFLLAGRVVRGVVYAAGQRTRLDMTLADLLGRLTSFVLAVLGLFVAAVIIFPAFKPGDLVTGLGITSVAIGFAFKDVLQNFFAGILILWRRPFVVGDQIRVKEHEGTVEEITVRSTRLKTYDGERAVLPNGDVYTSAILVLTAYDKRRVRFTVGIGYPDSIEEAREVIRRVLAETEGVLDDPGPWVYVTELAPSSVNFTVYFWVESPQANVLAVSDRVATGVKLALDAAQIDMPFPHTVVLFHDATGSRDGDIKRGGGEPEHVAEVTVAAEGGAGKTLAELALRGCVVAALKRDEKLVVPNGSTGLKAGDVLTLIGSETAVNAAREKLDRTN